ncbi:HAD-IA family hydrolase [Candidatus Woesearchaeota archaeon]|nr:HAD-IA family hydrolase [Candidatus Woesearchaeota archaeon]
MKIILKKLSKFYVVGIITSVSKETFKHVMEKNEIKGIKFVYPDSPIIGKHNAIKYLLRRYCLTNSEVMYVGDKIEDIQACKKAGIKIIAVPWGYNTKAALKKENPDYLVDKPQELLKILVPARKE